MRNSKYFLCTLAVLSWLAATGTAWSQRVRLPESAGAAVVPGGSDTRTTIQPTAPSTLAPVPATTAPALQPSVTLGTPTFDPYATAPGSIDTAPFLTQPPGTVVSPNQPMYTQPGVVAPVVPQQPPVLFPNGMALPGGPAWASPEPGRYFRVLQNIRFQFTWVEDNDVRTNRLQIHEFEVAATLNFPNFLWSNQPLEVSPIFALYLWDGPVSTVAMPSDLPPNAYGAGVDLAWKPRFTEQLGSELNVNVGVFSDFQSITSDAVRVQGTGLLLLNLTPTLTVKGGAAYLDRLKVKVLPAGGVLWQPNPQTRFDIYFPRPKLAQYWTTLGNTDIWWYVGGEYGGGNWVIQRITGVSDRVDINDIRVFGGLEWTGLSGGKGFFELGYVFDREVVYVSGVGNFEPRDAIMLRAGFVY